MQMLRFSKYVYIKCFVLKCTKPYNMGNKGLIKMQEKCPDVKQ